jgi:hypothetical protein
MNARDGLESFKNLINSFRSPTFEVLWEYNEAKMPAHQITLRVQAIEAAEAIAIDEWESPGRIQRNVEREAKRLLHLDDAGLSAWWHSPPKDDIPLAVSILRQEVRERIWVDGGSTSEEVNTADENSIRRAVGAVADGAPFPLPSRDAITFAASVGATPEKPANRRGGPQERAAYDDMVLCLASVFYELTGRAPDYSDTGVRPGKTFRGFVDAWIAAPGHRDRFREEIGAERRMRKAVVMWGKAPAFFAVGKNRGNWVAVRRAGPAKSSKGRATPRKTD